MSIFDERPDFTPQLAGYTGQGAFRFWCQKVLPIVYDDSLSYYELLNKVVIYLNNVIKDFGTLADNLDEVLKAYTQLQDWVLQFFDLDGAVEKALDEMANDGRLTDAFGPLIAQTINKWLDDHPEATTTVQDGSLTLDKFTKSLRLLTVKDYVTPEMFGAIGDGATDDSIAFEQAVVAGTNKKSTCISV